MGLGHFVCTLTMALTFENCYHQRFQARGGGVPVMCAGVSPYACAMTPSSVT